MDRKTILAHLLEIDRADRRMTASWLGAFAEDTTVDEAVKEEARQHLARLDERIAAEVTEMAQLIEIPYASDEPLPFSLRTGTDWAQRRPGAYVIGRIICHRTDGDPDRARNPYPCESGAWIAFNRGWNRQIGEIIGREAAR